MVLLHHQYPRCRSEGNCPIITFNSKQQKIGRDIFAAFFQVHPFSRKAEGGSSPQDSVSSAFSANARSPNAHAFARFAREFCAIRPTAPRLYCTEPMESRWRSRSMCRDRAPFRTTHRTECSWVKSP